MSSFNSPNQLGSDGVAYNPAQADLDMNGFSIINAGGGGGTITNIFGTPGQINVATVGTDATISLIPTAVSAGSYTNANITVDGLGRITSATSGPSSSAADWANYPAVATIQGGNQVMNGVRQIALSNPISTKALTVNFDNLSYTPGSGASMIDVNIGAETGEILTTCPSSKPTLSYNSGTETLSLLGPTTSGTTVLSSVALPGSGVETLAQVLARGNTAGSNNIDMNTTNKIVNCANPSSAQDVATKAYVDGRPTETLAATLLAGNSAGSSSLDMNGNSLLGANNITMPGVAPIITATNLAGTLSITALGGTNMATTGLCTIASTGRLSLGSAAYTTLENLHIDNSAITKETGSPDLSIDNLGYIRNNQALITLNPDSVNPVVFIDAATPGGQVVIQNNSVPTCTFTNTAITASKPLSFAGSLTGTLNASLNNITGVNNLAITNNNTQIGNIAYNNTYDAIETSVKIKPPSIVDKNNVTGTANQVLTSDGAGLIEWATVGGGGSQNLAQVLSIGNSAGSSAINMNNNAINNVGAVNMIDTTNPSGGAGALTYAVAGNTFTTNCSLNIGTNQTQTGVYFVTPFIGLRDVTGQAELVGIQYNRSAQTIQIGTAGGASGQNAKLSLPNDLLLNNNKLIGAQIQDTTTSVGTNGQYLVANGSGSYTWTTPVPPPTPVLPNNIITFDTQTPVLSPSLAMGSFGSGNYGNFLVRNAQQGNAPSFVMPTLTNGCNRVVVSVNCPGAGFSSGPTNSMGYLDLYDSTTGIATGGRFYSAGTPAYFPTTAAPGANYQQNLYMSDVFPAPVAGNTIEVRLWMVRWGNNLGSGITLYSNNSFCTVKVEPAINAP